MKTVSEWFNYYIDEISKIIDSYPFEDRGAYGRWLNQQFYLVQNSTRYLALAASLVDVNDSAEFRWWTHHLKEEVDHDKTVLADMKSIGYESKDEPLPETRALIGSQYFDIQKNGPDTLLGYALLLEGLSCKRCMPVAKRVEKAHGKKSVYLRLHGEVDQDHYPQGLKRVESMPPERQKTVLDNLHMSARLYIHLLNSLAERARQNKNAA